MNVIKIPVKALTAAAFEPYGDVIQANDKKNHFPINDGTAERYHDLATIDVGQENGRLLVNIFRAKHSKLPVKIKQMECHPINSQAFVPLGDQPYLVAVAPKGDFDAALIEVFVATKSQGVNFHAGTWHHACIALNQESDFLVLDRGDGGDKDANKTEIVKIESEEDVLVIDFGLR